MAATYDFTGFDANLLRTFDGGGLLIQDAVMYGAASLENDFNVQLTRDKAPLVRVDMKDGMKVASDNFTGQQLLDVKSRIATFVEGDIDIEIKFSDIEKAYKTYLGWLIEPARTLEEVRQTPFELFFVRNIVARHFEYIRLKTAYKGVYNAAAVGSENLTDGFIARFTAGRGVGGDIAANHVFEGAAITVNNAYAQVNGVANLIDGANAKLRNEALIAVMSNTVYDKYRANRRTLFPNFVGPADMPTVLDDYSNIRIVVEPGLAGKETILITKKDNLCFIANDDIKKYTINVVKQIKSWQISIRISAGFDYASPDWTFLNDRV